MQPWTILVKSGVGKSMGVTATDSRRRVLDLLLSEIELIFLQDPRLENSNLTGEYWWAMRKLSTPT